MLYNFDIQKRIFLDNLPPDTHVSAIGQPLKSLPVGQLIWSGPQTGGHGLWHIVPSMPCGPIEERLTYILLQSIQQDYMFNLNQTC